jgi:tetratricopeptide (TPR) repeat protein
MWHQKVRRFEDAKKLLHEAVKESDSCFPDQLANVYKCLGTVYDDLEEQHLAYEYFQRSLVMYRKLTDVTPNELVTRIYLI